MRLKASLNGLIYEYRMWIVSILLGWMLDICPKRDEGIPVINGILYIASQMVKERGIGPSQPRQVAEEKPTR